MTVARGPRTGGGDGCHGSALPATNLPPEPRRRLTWPDGAPRVGIHLGVATGLMKAARRARQIGATTLQIFSDNPGLGAPPRTGARAEFVAYLAAHDIAPVAIHASYLINLAGSAEPFASQSRTGLLFEMQRAPAFGARFVNTHIGSHRGGGHEAGIRRITDNVNAVLGESPPGVVLVLENSSGGGHNLGSRVEDLAAILEGVDPSHGARLAFCLDTAHDIDAGRRRRRCWIGSTRSLAWIAWCWST